MSRKRLAYCDRHQHYYYQVDGCIDCKHEKWAEEQKAIKTEVKEVEPIYNWLKTCERCKREKAPYNFRAKGKNSNVCDKCIERNGVAEACLIKLRTQTRIERLINMATRNKMQDLRNHLFETLEMVKDGDMDVNKAKSICEIAQVIINSAKVEVEAIKALGGAKGSSFLELETSTTEQ